MHYPISSSSPTGSSHHSAFQPLFSPTFLNPHYPSLLNYNYPLYPSLLGYGHPLPQEQCKSFTIDAILGRGGPVQDRAGSQRAQDAPQYLSIRPRDVEDGPHHPYHLPPPTGIRSSHVYGAGLTDREFGEGIKSWPKGGGKRMRTNYTRKQLDTLELEFEREQYVVGPERYYLANSLNLTEAQVKVWFQNRRMKERKQNLEQQHVKMKLSCKEERNNSSGSESQAYSRKMSGFIHGNNDSYSRYLPHPLEIFDQRRGGSGSCAGGGSASASMSSKVEEDSVHETSGNEGDNEN